MVPHIAAHKTHQRLQEFSISTPKRLLQQYRPIAAPDLCDGTSAVGESRHRVISLRRRICSLSGASSTDRCNTFCELLSRRLIEQGLSRPFIELPCDGTALRLTVQGQIGATRKILAQQSVGVFV